MNGTVLDVGEDRLILDVPGKKYHLDLTFPHFVDYETGGAQFNRKTGVSSSRNDTFYFLTFHFLYLFLGREKVHMQTLVFSQ